MEVKTKIDILVKGVPVDVAAELDRRADVHYRSRMGEVLTILTAVCRNKIELPDLPIGDGVEAEAAQNEAEAVQDGAQSTGDGQGGE